MMWEYNSIRVPANGGISEEMLDEQGVQGWELCTSYVNPVYPYHIVLLWKRPYGKGKSEKRKNECMEHCIEKYFNHV